MAFSKHRISAVTGVLWLLAAATPRARGQNIVPGTLTTPPKLTLVATYSSGNNASADFAVNSGDARFMYTGEQGGVIRVLDFNGTIPATTANSSVFLDLNSASALGAGVLVASGERGLIGAAFHPGFNDPSSPGFNKFYTFETETLASGGTLNFTHQTEYPGSPTNPTTYDAQDVLREWTVGPANGSGIRAVNTSIPSRVVLREGKPGPFHHGGGITFGPDGYMYIPLGDGGGGTSNGGYDGGNNSNNQGHTNPNNPDSPGAWTGQGNAQDRRNPYGKILRIKPTSEVDVNTKPSTTGGDYRVPLSNPYVANASGFKEEIYAYGFRNPFRISFDNRGPSPTNKLYVADVGQDRNTFSREELDDVVAGGNYGWVAKSGTLANNVTTTNGTITYSTSQTLIDPIAQYPTTQFNDGSVTDHNGGLAVLGGFVYRGNYFPELQGKYIFGDFDRGNGSGRLLFTNLGDPSLQVFDLPLSAAGLSIPASQLHGVAQDANGEIYYLFNNGQVLALVPEPSTAGLLGLGAFLSVARRRHR